jgi:hypothetical protein
MRNFTLLRGPCNFLNLRISPWEILLLFLLCSSSLWRPFFFPTGGASLWGFPPCLPPSARFGLAWIRAWRRRWSGARRRRRWSGARDGRRRAWAEAATAPRASSLAGERLWHQGPPSPSDRRRRVCAGGAAARWPGVEAPQGVLAGLLPRHRAAGRGIPAGRQRAGGCSGWRLSGGGGSGPGAGGLRFSRRQRG